MSLARKMRRQHEKALNNQVIQIAQNQIDTLRKEKRELERLVGYLILKLGGGTMHVPLNFKEELKGMFLTSKPGDDNDIIFTVSQQTEGK